MGGHVFTGTVTKEKEGQKKRSKGGKKHKAAFSATVYTEDTSFNYV
jgi:hypothetical protein